jgi:hypothetical protein
MFKERGVQSVKEDELANLSESVLNTKIVEHPYSATVGETLTVGLITFDKKVPENVINAVCGCGEQQLADMLKTSLELWNKDIDNKALRDAIKKITSASIVDLIVHKDTIRREDSLTKRLSLQSGLISFGVEFARSL